jgi:hypothetical protein
MFSSKRELILAVKDLQLSDNTVTRRLEVDMLSHQKSDWEMCDRFSLQFEESTGIGGAAQWEFIVMVVFSDFTAREELLEILPMKRRTQNEDTPNTLDTHAAEINICIDCLVSLLMGQKQ